MVRAIDWVKVENALPEVKRRQKRINIDSRGGPGYTVTGWYIFAPPGGTILLRRLQLDLPPVAVFVEIDTPRQCVMGCFFA